jgi:hypothetical protein
VTCARLRLVGDFAYEGEYADVKGEGRTMPEVFDDELTEAELDQLEALGAADDADLIIAQAEVELDA